jgi:hypothetical protein
MFWPCTNWDDGSQQEGAADVFAHDQSEQRRPYVSCSLVYVVVGVIPSFDMVFLPRLGGFPATKDAPLSARNSVTRHGGGRGGVTNLLKRRL